MANSSDTGKSVEIKRKLKKGELINKKCDLVKEFNYDDFIPPLFIKVENFLRKVSLPLENKSIISLNKVIRDHLNEKNINIEKDFKDMKLLDCIYFSLCLRFKGLRTSSNYTKYKLRFNIYRYNKNRPLKDDEENAEINDVEIFDATECSNLLRNANNVLLDISNYQNIQNNDPNLSPNQSDYEQQFNQQQQFSQHQFIPQQQSNYVQQGFTHLNNNRAQLNNHYQLSYEQQFSQNQFIPQQQRQQQQFVQSNIPQYNYRQGYTQSNFRPIINQQLNVRPIVNQQSNVGPTINQLNGRPVLNQQLNNDTQIGNQRLSTVTQINNQQSTTVTPIDDQQLNIETPIDDQQSNIETPIDDQQSNIETPIDDQQSNIETPIDDQQLIDKRINDQHQDKSKRVNKRKQDLSAIVTQKRVRKKTTKFNQ